MLSHFVSLLLHLFGPLFFSLLNFLVNLSPQVLVVRFHLFNFLLYLFFQFVSLLSGSGLRIVHLRLSLFFCFTEFLINHVNGDGGLGSFSFLFKSLPERWVICGSISLDFNIERDSISGLLYLFEHHFLVKEV